MKKLGIFLPALLIWAGASAQESSGGRQPLFPRLSEKGILNHLDVGVSVGTLGIGLDVALPVGDYVRVRAGYNYMPRISIHSDFAIETSRGNISDMSSKVGKINDKLAEYNIDLDAPGFEEYKALFEKFQGIEFRDHVTMGLRPNIHQFRFMVDVLPFRSNKHWSFTAGFFAGPSGVGDACNLEKETLILESINAYNAIYRSYLENNGITAGDYTVSLHTPGHEMDDPFYRYGLAGFNLGTFDDGTKAMMVPGDDATVRAEMRTSKFRPYLGFGYTTHLSKDRKWNMNVDAGLLFLCGAPSVYVDNVYKIDMDGIGVDADGMYNADIMRYNPQTYEYEPCAELRQHVDMVRELHDIPGKVGSMVHTISRFKVYPNASVTFSYRLF